MSCEANLDRLSLILEMLVHVQKHNGHFDSHFEYDLQARTYYEM